ncbi:aldehyde dehydrogenase family protein [Planctomycetota bacterium]|nr:aldehyde dehydrogenase family protein [Planctomycetota bacterium]
MTDTFQVVSPVDGNVLLERPLASADQLGAALDRAQATSKAWARTSLEDRCAAIARFAAEVQSRADELAKELTWQMGRPIRYSAGELRGFDERAQAMLAAAPGALAPIVLPDKPGFTRKITREPLGVVLVLAPWNYPWMCAVNAIVPALLAGNVVILKHSDQTPLVPERLQECADAAGLPEGVFQHLHMSHERVADAVGDARVDHVMFTGSVEGGRAVHRAAAERFVACGLELGGKDPAYVRADAPFDFTVENLVDGAFFNSGQSCCAIERIYVHADLYERFVEAFVAATNNYVLGDPLDPETTLGPVVRARSAASIQAHVDSAVAAGATAHIAAPFAGSDRGDQYMGPQVLTGVDHSMDVMKEETFGPVIGVMKVDSDDHAIRLMNDSRFGLTASVWTQDEAAALSIGDQVETGTWFMNRCDYLDPDLAWVGVKDSGRGCTLSTVGFEHLTRPKSYHLRTQT